MIYYVVVLYTCPLSCYYSYNMSIKLYVVIWRSLRTYNTIRLKYPTKVHIISFVLAHVLYNNFYWAISVPILTQEFLRLSIWATPATVEYWDPDNVLAIFRLYIAKLRLTKVSEPKIHNKSRFASLAILMLSKV